MTVELGPMGLLATEPGDVIEDYVNGLQPDGGEWTNWSRLSAHDHSGGQMGGPVAVTIPPGSITSGQLDPSVLAPYALTDGSKPFTGLVTMEADAIVRDAVRFGEQGTALAPDATLTRYAAGSLALDGSTTPTLRFGGDVTLTRTGAGALRLDTNLGVGVAPEAMLAGYPTVRIGRDGGVYAGSSNAQVVLAQNGIFNAAGSAVAVSTGAGSRVQLNAGSLNLDTAPSVAAGATQTWTTRASIAPAGTLTLTPNAGPPALVWGNGRLSTNAANPRVGADLAGANLELEAAGGYVVPGRADAVNMGHPSVKWNAFYGVIGTINTSAAEMKQDITPLDPAAALAAVLNTDPVTFTYTAPAPTAEQYELPDDPEQAEAVLHQRLVNAPLMEAARSQAGFVLSSPDYATDPLFETGTGQSNAANTAGVLLAAVKALATRVTALEGS